MILRNMIQSRKKEKRMHSKGLKDRIASNFFQPKPGFFTLNTTYHFWFLQLPGKDCL